VKANLLASASKVVENAVDEIGFRAGFKLRLVPKVQSWMEKSRRKRPRQLRFA
jgi:hypothetical protein